MIDFLSPDKPILIFCKKIHKHRKSFKRFVLRECHRRKSNGYLQAIHQTISSDYFFFNAFNARWNRWAFLLCSSNVIAKSCCGVRSDLAQK